MTPSEPRTLILPSHGASLARARRFVEECAASAGFSGITLAEITLAVHEAVSNAIHHGSPAGPADHVELRVAIQETELVVTVRDHGAASQLPAPSLPDPLEFAPRGRGLYLMHLLMDDVQFERDNGTLVRMTKRRDEPAASG